MREVRRPLLTCEAVIGSRFLLAKLPRARQQLRLWIEERISSATVPRLQRVRRVPCLI